MTLNRWSQEEPNQPSQTKGRLFFVESPVVFGKGKTIPSLPPDATVEIREGDRG